MKFGIYIRDQVTYERMLQRALEAEKLGFHGAYLNDHVHGFANDGKEDYLEAWTAMTGIGVQTSTLRVGQIVIFNSLRNPAFLAKSVSSLDNMISGRFDLLMGSGWNEPEYKGYDIMEGGRGMPSAKERVDRFEESLQILNLMLNKEVTDFEGKFWKLEGAINMPQPVQSPLPIIVGCSGPRMMRITAKYASGINHSTRMLTQLHENMVKFGDIHEKVSQDHDINPLSKFDISGFSAIRIANNSDEKNAMINDLSQSTKKSKEEVEREILVGTVDEIVDKLGRLADAGMHWMVTVPILHENNTANPVEYFHDNIMKEL